MPVTGASLTSSLLRFPWMTGTVIGAINWQALKLWWKGVPYVPPPAPIHPVRETRTP